MSTHGHISKKSATQRNPGLIEVFRHAKSTEEFRITAKAIILPEDTYAFRFVKRTSTYTEGRHARSKTASPTYYVGGFVYSVEVVLPFMERNRAKGGEQIILIGDSPTNTQTRLFSEDFIKGYHKIIMTSNYIPQFIPWQEGDVIVRGDFTVTANIPADGIEVRFPDALKRRMSEMYNVH